MTSSVPELPEHQQVHGGDADAVDAEDADPEQRHVAKVCATEDGDDRRRQRNPVWPV